jgi:hypothetical protein
MAWSKLDPFGLFSLTAATEITIELQPMYSYTLTHTGKDSAGNDDAQSALSAWLSTASGTITANNTVEDKKAWVADGGTITIGPGIEKLYVISTVGADAAIQIIRQSPTVPY